MFMTVLYKMLDRARAVRSIIHVFAIDTSNYIVDLLLSSPDSLLFLCIWPGKTPAVN